MVMEVVAAEMEVVAEATEAEMAVVTVVQMVDRVVEMMVDMAELHQPRLHQVATDQPLQHQVATDLLQVFCCKFHILDLGLMFEQCK